MKKTKFAKIVALMVMAVMILTSCGGGGGPVAVDDSGGGRTHVYFAQYQTPLMDWDPHIASDLEPAVFFNVYETLLRFDPETDTFIYVLAESYDISEDGYVWTFHLRRGVTFHNGEPFNADAVKFTVDRILRMGMSSAYLWAPVDEVVVVDDHTVEFHLNDPAPVNLIVSSNMTAWIICPSVGDDDEAATAWFSEGNMNGTGPYMLQSFVPGSEVVLTMNPNYWGGWPEGRQNIETIMIRAVSEAASRRQLMESGEADMTVNLTSEDNVALMDNPNVEVVVTDSYQNMTMFINTQKPPLNNVLVRQAISHTYPAYMYVDYVQLGHFASIPTDTLMHRAIWGARQGPGEPYPFDLDRAAELLAEAGYPDGGFTLRVTVMTGVEDRRRIAELWQSELAKVGITLEIDIKLFEAMHAEAREADKTKIQDFMTIGNWPDIVHPSSMLYNCAHSDGAWSFSYFNSPELDSMLDHAYYVSAVDLVEGKRLFEELNQWVADQAIFINMGDRKSVKVISDRLQGYKPNPAYEKIPFFYDMWLSE